MYGVAFIKINPYQVLLFPVSDFASQGLPLPCCLKNLFLSYSFFLIHSSVSIQSHSCNTKVEDFFGVGVPDTWRCQFNQTICFYWTDIKTLHIKRLNKYVWKEWLHSLYLNTEVRSSKTVAVTHSWQMEPTANIANWLWQFLGWAHSTAINYCQLVRVGPDDTASFSS